MSDNDEKFDAILANLEDQMLDALHSFDASFRESVKDSGAPTMDQIEIYWKRLDTESKKIWLDSVSDYLSAINEKELIARKKGNG